MPDSSRNFNYDLDYSLLNLRERPELYRVGRGEMGVLLVRPYKDEILPHWRFKTPDIARESSEKIYELFLAYKAANDFIGMDMARKFLQMGYTRARRYANHRGVKNTTALFPTTKKDRAERTGEPNCRARKKTR